MNRSSALFICTLLICGCSRDEPVADPAPGTATQQPPALAAPQASPPPGEPPEDALQKIEFANYAAIEKAGGLPVTVSASGQQLLLKPKLYSVRKEKCTPTPQAPEGWYECSLTISVSLAEDGSDPSEQGERISVKWDSLSSAWVSQ